MIPTQSVIYSRIPRSDPDLIARAAQFGIADLHEGLGAVAGRMCLMSPAMRPIAPGQKVCGSAVTAFNYPGDNLAIHAALNVAGAGDVLVLTNGGGHQGALWGDVACNFAVKKGVAGTVVHGATRDTDAIRELGYPVWATAISVEHPEKNGPAAVNVPVVVDGVLVEPGDIICGDGDGVLVIPRALLRLAVENAEARAAKEVTFRQRIADGEVLFDIIGIRQVVERLGIEQKDCTWEEDR
ncbi:4-carboxy-4-hydroxy-2-oxoadipate aldolase/oxaloacetate decarboxylase [Novosphingobium album (ex Liu et al. 2023)]|uniref:4-carboxy-4-hydroxy-2-oxoadipate aldolase/oxaloacetate decarboxylase n=1 Tax=Novosphingobium album (ex Liu et al. 2023) TaxID=3031130 RepID=A0ABT5WK78_9SPHN|nr:4-carboxy-4-hydroxy-2-oxoadipate aldolase/oxaloacetate decarboxylase [Novosphingobium album (ex Liu et al. 2023)]MDE8650448.1 4-carboxy-4-hydroxy-2-oxoadipate aldolase/oxaloacetate decarboxylase [Novosphingobium album (ex Liu et al. 2023)]